MGRRAQLVYAQAAGDAQLSWCGLRFQTQDPDAASQVEARLGTHFIPGLETPEGWFIHDSTPIGLMLHAKYPDRPIMPSSPVQRIAAHLLEDWADEWFGRYAISSRWCYPHNIDHVAIGFYANAIGKFMAEGLTEDEQAEAAERFGLSEITLVSRPARIVAAALIRQTMFGATLSSLWLMPPITLLITDFCWATGQPGDFTFAGLFKAHVAADPEPRSWIEGSAPAMLGYMDRIFDARSDEGQYLPTTPCQIP